MSTKDEDIQFPLVMLIPLVMLFPIVILSLSLCHPEHPCRVILSVSEESRCPAREILSAVKDDTVRPDYRA